MNTTTAVRTTAIAAHDAVPATHGLSVARATDQTSRVSTMRRALVLITAFLAMVTAMVGIASPASAVQVGSSGYPGGTTLPLTYGAWTGFATGQLTVPYRTVTESARYAAYNQYVCVRANLVEASGARWIDSSSSTSCQWILAAATSTTVNGAVFGNLSGLNTQIYAVNIVVTWQLSNGALIGSKLYDYSGTTDYRCSTIHCKVAMTTWGGGAFVEFDN